MNDESNWIGRDFVQSEERYELYQFAPFFCRLFSFIKIVKHNLNIDISRINLSHLKNMPFYEAILDSNLNSNNDIYRNGLAD